MDPTSIIKLSESAEEDEVGFKICFKLDAAHSVLAAVVSFCELETEIFNLYSFAPAHATQEISVTVTARSRVGARKVATVTLAEASLLMVVTNFLSAQNLDSLNVALEPDV